MKNLRRGDAEDAVVVEHSGCCGREPCHRLTTWFLVGEGGISQPRLNVVGCDNSCAPRLRYTRANRVIAPAQSLVSSFEGMITVRGRSAQILSRSVRYLYGLSMLLCCERRSKQYNLFVVLATAAPTSIDGSPFRVVVCGTLGPELGGEAMLIQEDDRPPGRTLIRVPEPSCRNTTARTGRCSALDTTPTSSFAGERASQRAYAAHNQETTFR